MSTADAMLRTLATALPEVGLPAGVPHLGAAEARLEGGIAAMGGETLLSGVALLLNVDLLATALGSDVPVLKRRNSACNRYVMMV